MKINQGDTAPDLIADLSGLDGPTNLTSATEIRVKGYQSDALLINRVITGNSSGVATMQWQAGDTDIARQIGFKWEVTWPDGKVQTFPAQGLSWVTVAPDPIVTGDAPSVTGPASVEFFISPESYNAIGDGVTDDAAALTACSAAAVAAGMEVRLTRGKTYKANSTVTFGSRLNLNGAALVITGQLISTSGYITGGEISRGTVSVSSQVKVENLSAVRLINFDVINTLSTGNGVYVNTCTDIVIDQVNVTEGFRGIILDRCDRYTVTGCTVSEMRDSGAYGILARSYTGEVHGDGWIHDNLIRNTWFGICLNGGEADSTQPAWSSDYTIQRVSVRRNIVTVDDPALIGCIWATRSRWISLSENIVENGHDVGVDFEYCADSTAIGNTISDVSGGALAAIFESKRILFQGNKITFTRTLAGSGATSGVTWVNTSNLGMLLRDDPVDIRVLNNTFHSLNGTLMQLDGSSVSTGIEFSDNDLKNAYYVSYNSTLGATTDMQVNRNRARFSVNINRPVIYIQSVTNLSLQGNDIVLQSGEVQESSSGAAITVQDPGSTYSSQVTITRNRVSDPAGTTNAQIALNTNDSAIVATITDNIAERIGTYWLSGAYHNRLVYGRNINASGEEVSLTASDNSAVPCGARQARRVNITVSSLTAPSLSGFNLGQRDVYVFNGTSAGAWTLPSVTACRGAVLTFKNRGTATLTINTSNGTSVIFDAALVASVNVVAGAALQLINDGTYWNVI